MLIISNGSIDPSMMSIIEELFAALAANPLVLQVSMSKRL